MPHRAAATVFMVIAAIAGAAGCAREPRPPAPYAGLMLAQAKAKPDFTLTDDRGRPFRFRAATDGYLTLLYFGYTHCADVCPIQMANIAGAKHSLPPADQARLRVVFVTTDPDRDTQDRLRAWLGNFDSSFIGLRGTTAEIHALETTFGLPQSQRGTGSMEYEMGHAAMVLAFTPDDSLRLMYPSSTSREGWTSDLRRLLASSP